VIETSNKRNKEKSEVVHWISVEQTESYRGYDFYLYSFENLTQRRFHKKICMIRCRMNILKTCYGWKMNGDGWISSIT
jgi:hypothetical protein